jgi:hypothetical protein
LAGGALCCHAIVTLKNADLRGALSALCEHLASDPEISPDLARDAFATTNVDLAPVVPGHTHPEAAAMRSSATVFGRKMASFCGVSLYVVEMAKSDQRKGLRGSRQWFWAKDTNAKNRNDVMRKEDVLYICDVDYYIDMPHFLGQHEKPVLLYTVVPDAAVTISLDNTTTLFTEDGLFNTIVDGGGSYCHRLWDYAGDSFKVVQWSRYVPWIPTKVLAYAAERKQVAKNRQVVLLTPLKIFSGVSAILAYFLLEGKTIKRFDPIVRAADGQTFVRFLVHGKNRTCVTTARAGSYLCATIGADVDDAIAGVARLGTNNLMMPTVASWLPKEERPAAVVLTEYHRACTPRKIPIVYPLEAGVRAYQFEPRQYDQDAKPKLQAFMSPLVHAAYAPIANDAGERQCVKGRINNLKKEEPRPCSFRDQCIGEFATLLTAGMNLEPVCYDYVAEKQTNPAQKLSLMKAVLCGPHVQKILKCFIKAEAYADVKDPRNISTYPDDTKLEMAMFSLALSREFKKFAWYGPGKTPEEIAMRMVEICMNAKHFMNISDLHRMDGTITYCLRFVDRVTLMKAFPRHRDRLNELLKRNVDNTGKLPNGTTFSQDSSHGSGCSATSLLQTLRAAFAAYLGFRHTVTPEGHRYDPQEAFDALGIHFGDDGCDADLPVEDHKWACGKVGLILEANTVQRGQRGVNFLARYYSPEIWTGSPDSMCDIKRQLSKFHTTVRMPAGVTSEQKLVEKAMSYVATDGNTPIIGELCKQVLLLSTYRPTTLLGIGNWWSRFDESTQYPNANVGGWMDVELSEQFPEFDRSIFNQWLVAAKSIPEILEAPLCAEPRPPTPASVDVVVDNQIVDARPTAIRGPDALLQETAEVTATANTARTNTTARRTGNKTQAERRANPQAGRPAASTTQNTRRTQHARTENTS